MQTCRLLYPFTKPLLVLALLVTCASTVKGQDNPAEEEKAAKGIASLRVEGMVGVAVNSNTVALNIGGPALKVILNQHMAIGVGAFPSLFMSPDRIEPKLGLSPRIEYKRFVCIAPFYHFTSPSIWIGTVGLCYRLHP